MFIFGLIMSWISPKEDHTSYRHTTASPKTDAAKEETNKGIGGTLVDFFKKGQEQKDANAKKEADAKRKQVAIRYFAPQVLGSNLKGPKALMSGSKLIGVLLNPIDTRAQSLVRAKIVQGGEFGGITIEKDSTLIGKYSYQGSGEKVYLNFTRLDSPDGDSKKLAAVALDAGDYTPGVLGEEFTGNGVKIATSIGLDMFAGMTDTLTDRESLGNTYGGVQARPTMKNALLQGMSKASQDQAGRVASSINSERGYVIVHEGKEIIIELTEDFKNESARSKNGY